MEALIKSETGTLEINQEWAVNFRTYLIEKAKWDIAEKEVKAALLEAHENGVEVKGADDLLQITFKKGSTRTTLDSKRLKEEQPEIFEEYSKTSETAPSVSITPKATI